jgi:UDP-glucose 4-epimerase
LFPALGVADASSAAFTESPWSECSQDGADVRIVITGASGNLGTAVRRRLSDVGGHEVVGIARRPPTAPGVRGADGTTWVALDLADETSEAALRQAMADADAVVHLAWGFQPSHDTAYLERLDVGGTRRVLAAADSAGVRHLVHLSSIGAYAARTGMQPVDESWPTTGIPTLAYSRHKAAAEHLLDAYENSGGRLAVTRIRPGIVGQRSAGSSLLRYTVPAYVPATVLRHLPVLPLDPRLAIPLVHSDDVADAVVRALQGEVAGAFHLAASPPVGPQDIARAFESRAVPFPAAFLRGLAWAAWQARLQPVDPGWLDLALSVPMLDTARAERELGWSPSRTGPEVLDELVQGLVDAASDRTPALRPRTVVGQLTRAARRGPISHRRLP